MMVYYPGNYYIFKLPLFTLERFKYEAVYTTVDYGVMPFIFGYFTRSAHALKYQPDYYNEIVAAALA